jgi:hypothetical protein
MTRPQVPAADSWDRQVAEAFGFLGERGFRVVDSGTYRLGNWSLFGNGNAGIHLDCDGDSRSLSVTLVRLEDNRMPDRWWEPRVSLGLREVAAALAPESLNGASELPPIEREADRAPHLRFWASVLRDTAGDWLDGDRAWFDRTESRIRENDGR